MMKLLYKIAIVFLPFSLTAQSQEKLKTLVATGPWKRINTLPLFETKPEPEKPVAEVKKETPAISTTDNQPIAVAANTPVPEKVPEPESKRNKRTKKTKAEEPAIITEQTAAQEIPSKKNSFIPLTEASTEIAPAENEAVATISKRKKKEKKPTETKEIARAETKPAAEPPKAESPAKPKKKAPEPKPKTDNIVTENTLSFQPVEGAKMDLKPLEGVESMYFDKQNRYTKRENAYFYRKGKFNKSSGQPTGLVEDFYAKGDKPKFKGQYERYNNGDEAGNNKFDGTCEFYDEDGAKTIGIYSKGRLESEFKFNKEGQQIAEAQYNFEGKRKKFKEFIFEEGKQIGTLEGAFDSGSGLEKAIQQINLPNKFYSSIEYLGGCPSNQGEFMRETGIKYKAVFQDFTCNPEYNKLWKFSNSSNFTTTHSKDKNSFAVRSTPSPQAQAGFLHTPVTHDFYKKPFEIEAIFELSDLRSMPELGIVWQYMDPKNYAYFKINTAKKTFDINDIEEDIPDELMKGVKNQLPELTDNQVKLTLKKVGDDFFYLVNDQPLPFAKVKFPRLEKDSKIWNIGFYFKASASNESIILKHLEIKLL